MYELPEDFPDLTLGDGLLNSLGVEAQNLFNQDASLTKKEEQDEILKDFMEEYKIDDIRDTMDETAQVPENIYFFYGGDSDQFVNALEFIGLSPINREFCAFLLSDLSRKTRQRINLVFMLNLEIFFTIIIILVKTFTVSYCLNEMTRQLMSLKKSRTKTVLKHILALFCKVFQ